MKGEVFLGPGMRVDVARLLTTKLLVQANSGGGKSWTLRRLCEQTYGACQHIIIDPEGEFHTLRERHDYALLGKGGDGPADLKSAALLARRLLELGVSAIIDIFELGSRREQFVKLFLESLVSAPKALWHPVLVVIDEAHKFCPETGRGRGESASTSAVIDLMTLGRKRGFCGVLATQRVSKLHKDAAAEANNKLIGRCSLDLDRERSAKELGLSAKEDVLGLRDLAAGEFFAYGPALTSKVTKFTVGSVLTTHPEAGDVALPPTPPRAKVKKLLEQLADLPHEAEEEAKTVAQLQNEVRQLKADLRAAQAGQKTEVETVKVPVLDPKQVALVDGFVDKMLVSQDRLAQAQQVVVTEAGNLRTMMQAALREVTYVQPKSLPTPPPAVPRVARTPRSDNASGPNNDEGPDDRDMAPARQRLLDTIALLTQLGVARERMTVAAWLGVHPNNKGYTNNLGALRTAGLLEGLELTEQGRRAARSINIPSQAALRERLLAPLAPARRHIVELLLAKGAMGREELANELNVHPNNKSFTNNVGALRSRQLITKGWPVQAGPVLYMR